jgi:hypothetical protein
MFIRERLPQLDEAAKAWIAKLERELASLKRHEDEAQGNAFARLPFLAFACG